MKWNPYVPRAAKQAFNLPAEKKVGANWLESLSQVLPRIEAAK